MKYKSILSVEIGGKIQQFLVFFAIILFLIIVAFNKDFKSAQHYVFGFFGGMFFFFILLNIVGTYISLNDFKKYNQDLLKKAYVNELSFFYKDTTEKNFQFEIRLKKYPSIIIRDYRREILVYIKIKKKSNEKKFPKNMLIPISNEINNLIKNSEIVYNRHWIRIKKRKLDVIDLYTWDKSLIDELYILGLKLKQYDLISIK